jgi:hypothetical protein
MARKPHTYQKLYATIESKIRLDMILYAFWAMFWILNGLDKFFNGTPAKHDEFGKYVKGWFGMNRDDKFIHYFDRLNLPAELALGSLYSFAVFEVIVGMVFLLFLVRPQTPAIVYRLAFKSSIMLFFVFCTGDILFGDRMELWEHGTFMVLTLMTYQLYLTRSVEHADVLGPQFLKIADINRDAQISTEEFDRFMQRLRTTCVISHTTGTEAEPAAPRELTPA